MRTQWGPFEAEKTAERDESGWCICGKLKKKISM